MKPTSDIEPLLRLYNEKIKEAQQNGDIVECEAEVMRALIYVSSYKDFYRKNKQALPNNEFNLLVEIAKKISFEDLGDGRILLIENLIFYCDLLTARSADKEKYLSIFVSIFKKELSSLDQPTLHKENTSEVAQSLNNLLTLKIAQYISLKHNVIDDEIFYDLLRRKNFIFDENKISDEILIELMSHFIYLGKHCSSGLIVNFIHQSYLKHENKEKFLSNFICAFKKLKEYMMDEKSLYRYFSFFMSQALPVLVDIFSEDAIADFIKEILIISPIIARESLDNFAFKYPLYSDYAVIFSCYADKKELKILSPFCTDLNKNIRCLCEQLSIATRIFNKQVCISNSSFLDALPLHIQKTLEVFLPENSQIRNKFKEFIETFIKINDKADEFHKKNIATFFLEHGFTIIQLLRIMGTFGVSYLKQFLAYTVLPLDRELKAIHVLSDDLENKLMHYFRELRFDANTPAKDINVFKNCIIALGLLQRFDDYNPPFFSNTMPSELLTTLMRSLISRLFVQSIDLTSAQIDKILDDFGFEKLSRLFSATLHMRHEDYYEIYENFLKSDLIGNDFNDFLHNTNQENEIGRELAIHNQRIQTELGTHGINYETALRYKESLDIVVDLNEGDSKNSETLFFVLWSYIDKLKSIISNNHKTSSKLVTANEYLHKISTKTNSSHSDEMSYKYFFNQNNIKKALGDLIVELQKILSDNASNEFSNELHEFSQHIIQHYNIIKEDRVKSKKKGIESYSFSIKQWKKEDVETFFLGDAVGCCLATNGEQFQAIVQRRMDDAMLFHVAIDNKTKKPAALIWLYLAETQDKKIVLIANFFEVNTKYAQNHALRLNLLNGLLEFTHQYCEANPNISAFYMNQLEYGWNMNDLKDYEIENIALSDKLGGPFMPGFDNFMKNHSKELTKEKYYLSSVDKERFHRFTPETLARKKNELMQNKNNNTSQNVSKSFEGQTSFFSKKVFNAKGSSNPQEIQGVKY